MAARGSRNARRSTCTILAVGDTSPPANNPRSIFQNIRTDLADGDIRFCQAERVFSKRGQFHRPSLAPHSRRDPKCAEAYKWAGFDVVSTAGNHSGDWGSEGVIDTVATLETLGIRSIGSGRDIRHARAPAIFERNGVTVGFLGYASVILPQYWATEDQPGVAPLRVNTFYEPYEYQPGCPARIITIPFPEDMQEMERDVAQLKKRGRLRSRLASLGRTWRAQTAGPIPDDGGTCRSGGGRRCSARSSYSLSSGHRGD